jgi:PKD repeat protein
MRKIIYTFLILISLVSCHNGIVKDMNTAPVASFEYYPNIIDTSTYVNFDASASYDNESDITYSWNFDDEWTEATTQPQTTYKFSEIKVYSIRLKVIDELGWYSINRQDVEVN